MNVVRALRIVPAAAMAFSLALPAGVWAAPSGEALSRPVSTGLEAPPAQAPAPAQARAGAALAWGNNLQRQLGPGATSLAASQDPVLVPGLDSVAMVAAGERHSLALKSDGTVWSWGSEAAALTQVPGLSGVTVISAGTSHSLALKSDGTVWAWGTNDFGELGNGNKTPSATPVQAVGLSGVTAIAAGSQFSLAVASDGAVWSWGYNQYGQLGNGSSTTGERPARVAGLSGVLDVDAGRSFGMALKADGTVWTWGANDYGQLGNGQVRYVGPGDLPKPVPGISGAKWISAGVAFALALTADGAVWSWGENTKGQLGNGQVGPALVSASPVRVVGLPPAVMVSAGDDHSLALLADGTVAGWGYNFWHQVGGPQRVPATDCRCLPTPVTGLASGLAFLAAGREHSLGIQLPSAAPPASPAAPAAPAGPVAQGAGTPPLGQYGCLTVAGGSYAGNLVLVGEGAYVWYDEPGSYALDSATGAIAWLSGPVAALGFAGEHRRVGSPYPNAPGVTYAKDTIVLTGTLGERQGDLISCEYEGAPR